MTDGNFCNHPIGANPRNELLGQRIARFLEAAPRIIQAISKSHYAEFAVPICLTGHLRDRFSGWGACCLGWDDVPRARRKRAVKFLTRFL